MMEERAGEGAQGFPACIICNNILYLSVVYIMHVYWPRLAFEQVNLYIVYGYLK